MSNDEAYMRLKMQQCGVPEHLRDGIVLYLFHGIEMGGCLTAVFSNDLMESFGRADENTARGMRGLCTFIYSYAPSQCHGSYARVESWMEARRKIATTGAVDL